MLTPQLLLSLSAELVVDLFAGGGGASTGIERAIGRHVDIAINHDPEAVALHAINHPQTQHFVSDVFEVNPGVVTDGRPVGLLWASPDCKHFSKAKGSKPVSKKIRSLAWVVVKWAKHPTAAPRVIWLENVEEFQTWGPLGADGRPCVARKGLTFRRWVRELQRAGYVVEWRELRACDYGAPTTRKRLFLCARRDGEPIVWPVPTHAAKPERGSSLRPWRTAAECIDWSIPCPSIFERQRPLAENTMRRIARGVMKYVVNAAKPFIVHAAHGEGRPGGVQRWGSGAHDIDKPMPTLTAKAEHLLAVPTIVKHNFGEKPCHGIDEPLHTVTTQHNKHALVTAFLAKHYGGNESPGSSLDRGIDTITTQDHHHLVSAHITKFREASAGSGAAEPLHTVTAGGEQVRPGTGNAMGLVTSSLVKLRGTSSAAGVEDPLHTVSAQGTHHAEVRALLMKWYGTEQDGADISAPLGTVTTRDRFGLVTVKGELYAIADIGMRMLEPRELYRAQGFPDSYIIDRGADGRVLPKHAQVRMCGNSVCPPIAAALVAANYREAAMREAA